MTRAPADQTALDRLPAAVLARLQPLANRVRFDAGNVIFREGRDTPFLAAIESGRVALRLRMAEHGRRLTLVTVEPPELLGWSAIVSPHRTTVDAVALEPTELVTFEAHALRELIAADEAVAAHLLPLVLQGVADRLNASWSQLLDMYGAGEAPAW